MLGSDHRLQVELFECLRLIEIIFGEQRKDFEGQGYLLVSGLIPDAVAIAAETAMRDHLKTAKPGEHAVLHDAALTACYAYAAQCLDIRSEVADSDASFIGCHQVARFNGEL